MVQETIKEFAKYIEKKGLKTTQQRNDIIRTFLKSGGHLSVDDLHQKVKKVNPRVGYATVYRTLKLLAESGVAVERHFDDGHTRYEHLEPEEHHDHLICVKCGNIIEFEDKNIESLQEKVANKHGFRVVTHNLEMYGYCKKCNGNT